MAACPAEALHLLVPSCRNLFDWTDAQGRLLRYCIEGPIDVALARLYFDEFHNRREAEAMLPFQALSRLPAGVRGQGDMRSNEKRLSDAAPKLVKRGAAGGVR